MHRVYIVIALLFLAAAAFAATPQREILIVAGEHASPAIVAAADALAKELPPVLAALQATQGVTGVERVTSERVLKDYNLAAFNHLVVIGLPSDPLMKKVWEHYAAVDEGAKTLYAQGWGYLQGDLGYLEADRNPFLHSRRIKEAPFETVLFKISGTSEAGVLAALTAFKTGLFNGIVPAGAWKRPKTTILDLDPQPAPSPLQLADAVAFNDAKGAAVRAPLAGWSQVPGNEYRAYIDVAGAEPTGVWRYKYLLPGALDHAQTPGWMAGFHRMAYGNAVTIAAFATPDAAQKTAEAIGTTGGWHKLKPLAGLPCWQANQPTDENMALPLGTITLTWKGPYLLMTSLPNEAVPELLQGLVAK